MNNTVIPMLAVIVPIFRNAERTRVCLESVRRASDPRTTQLILVNDASPEEDIHQLCSALAAEPNVQLIDHQQNQGFVKSVNAGIEAAGDADVVILNSDTEVSSGWLDRLAAAADQNPDAATITPFSNNATVCSYPDMCLDNALPKGHTVDTLDTHFRTVNAGQVIEVPTGVGFCMYIRRAALDGIGHFDEAAFGRGYGEENDWCMRATEAGWRHLACADLFVMHAGGASFGSEAAALQSAAQAVLDDRYPNYNATIAHFIKTDPLEPFRNAVDAARARSGEAEVVLEESRRRAIRLRADWYGLDAARHEQVTAAQRLLDESRAEAREREAALHQHITEQVEETRQREAAFTKQLEELKSYSDGLVQQCRDLEQRNEILEKMLSQLKAMWLFKLQDRLRRLWSR